MTIVFKGNTTKHYPVDVSTRPSSCRLVQRLRVNIVRNAPRKQLLSSLLLYSQGRVKAICLLTK